MFNLFHNVEYIILTKYHEWSLTKRQTHNSTKIKMDKVNRSPYGILCQKTKVFLIYFLMCVSILWIFGRSGCWSAFPPRSWCFLSLGLDPIDWLTLLSGFWPERHRFLNHLGLVKQTILVHDWNEKAQLTWVWDLKNSTQETDVRRVWMAGFNF